MARALIVAAFVLAGCAQVPRAPEDSAARKALLEVPFVPSGGDQCGPSSLASVLRYWGSDADPGRLKEEIYLAPLKGTLAVDLLLAAQSHGLSAQMLEGDLDRIKGEIDAGRPVIAFLNLGFRAYPIGHFVVVTGYDDGLRGVYAHSGKKRNEFMPYRRFDKQWRKTERWTLVMRPSARRPSLPAAPTSRP